MERLDCIVIGAGPAGLSAAITLKIRNKSVLVIGNAPVSDKVVRGHEINNYLGLPAVKGTDLAERFRRHAESMGVDFYPEQVVTVYAMGDYFSVLAGNNETFTSKTVILAAGVDFGKPYPGEEEFLGRGISYCATCDAPLYRDKKVVVIGASGKAREEADFLEEIAKEVIYLPASQGKQVAFQGHFKAEVLEWNGQEIAADGFFILRDSVPLKQLVPGIVMDGNHVAVNRQMETSISGCFACGDITGLPYQYIKAAGEGNVAALSVVDFLAKVVNKQ